MSDPKLDKALRDFNPIVETGDPLSKALAELVAQVVVCKADERVARAMYERASADRGTLYELVARLLDEVHLARGHECQGRGVPITEGWRTCEQQPCRRGRDTLAGISEGRWPTGPAVAARIHMLDQELADERVRSSMACETPPDGCSCAGCSNAADINGFGAAVTGEPTAS